MEQLVIKTLIPLLLEYLKHKSEKRVEQPERYLINSSEERKLKKYLGEANRILNDRKHPVMNHQKLLCKLADTKEEAEIYLDGMNYFLNGQNYQHTSRSTEIGDFLSKFKKRIDEVQKPLNTSRPSGGTSRDDKGKNIVEQSSGEVTIPPGLVRKFILFLSAFPEGYVFNWNQITRLAAAYGVTPGPAGERVEELRQQLSGLIEVVDGCWKPNSDPLHFRIGNNVKSLSLKWPENEKRHHFKRDAYAVINERRQPEELYYRSRGGDHDSKETTEKLDETILSSLAFLGPGAGALRLDERKFPLLKILSLRIKELREVSPLQNLLLLRYLDLKYTSVADYEWLKSLGELEVLDLRYTKVMAIDRRYLENLRKLKHLLLGYTPGNGDTPELLPQVLTGAELKVEEKDQYLPAPGFPPELETLRAIRWPNAHTSANSAFPATIVDLSLTGLTKRMMGDFWKAVENCKKLTSLGVEYSADDILTSCPAKSALKRQLKRLRVEGRFTECRDLNLFSELVDLTLISPELNPYIIPTLQKLVCLRLYRARGVTDLKFEDARFKSLKKLVIGDMKKLKTVTVGCNVVTLKFCNLEQFDELICFDEKKHLLKRKGERTTEPSSRSSSKKCIFLKGIGKSSNKEVEFHKGTNVTMYCYNRNKLFYELK